jgi:hypothetical protein
MMEELQPLKPGDVAFPHSWLKRLQRAKSGATWTAAVYLLKHFQRHNARKITLSPSVVVACGLGRGANHAFKELEALGLIRLEREPEGALVIIGRVDPRYPGGRVTVH